MLWFYNSKNLFDELLRTRFVFLAGPSDRKTFCKWRLDFIKKCPNREKYNFFIPKYCTEQLAKKYSDCAELDVKIKLEKSEIYALERRLLELSHKTVFWVDRNFRRQLKGLTTNIEFGNFYNSNKCICGSPPDADKIDYMKYVWEIECKKKWYFVMDDLIEDLLKVI